MCCLRFFKRLFGKRKHMCDIYNNGVTHWKLKIFSASQCDWIWCERRKTTKMCFHMSQILPQTKNSILSSISVHIVISRKKFQMQVYWNLTNAGSIHSRVYKFCSIDFLISFLEPDWSQHLRKLSIDSEHWITCWSEIIKAVNFFLSLSLPRTVNTPISLCYRF